MTKTGLHIWTQAPFLRLLLPLASGICCQQIVNAERWWMYTVLAIGCMLVAFQKRVSYRAFSTRWVAGIGVHMAFFAAGMLAYWHKDSIHHRAWLGRMYSDHDFITGIIAAPPVQKSGSWKTIIQVEQCGSASALENTWGHLLVYFNKDCGHVLPVYGDRVLFRQSLQPIANAGNPGEFDYRAWCARQGIHHRAWLRKTDFLIIPGNRLSFLQQFLLDIQLRVLKIIRQRVRGPKEAGLAEALLMGYKDDLDKDLVQAYTNTGVVHIIAISGMHLGLIYWLLSLLCRPLQRSRALAWLQPAFVIAGLWLFSMLAGGGPSIVRSAIMFTSLVLGQQLQRESGMYNSLAAAAFLLLCINPFLLWDAGFQLSFTAVLSILVFSKPVSHLFYFRNRMVQLTWNLVAVTLAAQVLTTPVCLYQFHQFPIYFLVTNLLAVPLSSLIVLMELLLCVLSPLAAPAAFTGNLLAALIHGMNGFIEYMERMPFAAWKGINISLLQVLLMYGSITAAAIWLMRKNNRALLPALLGLLIVAGLRAVALVEASHQQRLVVYNINKQQAMDIIIGRKHLFVGDSIVAANDYFQSFYCYPSRTWFRALAVYNGPAIRYSPPHLQVGHSHIGIIEKGDDTARPAFHADLLILSKNAPVRISQLHRIYLCRHFVIDASNAHYRVHKWLQEARNLHLDCISVVDKGAFVMKLD